MACSHDFSPARTRPATSARFPRVLEMIAFLLLMFLAVGMAGPAKGSPPTELERGGAFARTNCARCHAVDGPSASPVPEAPAFEAIGSGMTSGRLTQVFSGEDGHRHPTMPQWLVDPADVEDLAAYMRATARR